MDNHATTPVDPRVLEEMLPYFTGDFGNAASRNHPFGWHAEKAVERARGEIAELIGAQAKEIIFTSGATESDNLAIKGTAEYLKSKGNHIITVPTEHKAVLDSCKALSRKGYEITYLQPDSEGLITAQQVREAITDKTILVTVMFANNEIGTVQPIAEIGKVCKEKGVLFHCDAVQGVGKLPFNVDEMGVDMVSISAHKMYGPKGVGALYIRKAKPRVRLSPIIDGGGHERGMRSGTLNVPGIVGLGAACRIARAEMAEEADRLTALRNRMRQRIQSKLDYVHLNGSWEHRLPGNLNLSFEFVEGESILMALNKEVAVSSGSACTSASLEPSYVLRAVGIGEELAHTSIRFGLGRFNTLEEVDYVADMVVEKIARLREMSPLYEMAKEGIDLKSIQWAAH
jgi:cysteine desulfurase